MSIEMPIENPNSLLCLADFEDAKMGIFPDGPQTADEIKNEVLEGQILAVMDPHNFTATEMHIYHKGQFFELPLGQDGPFGSDPVDSDITSKDAIAWVYANIEFSGNDPRLGLNEIEPS